MNTKSIYFTIEHSLFRDEVRVFIKKEILPYIEQWETEREIPKEIWKKIGAAGFFGLQYQISLGGSQKDFFYSVIFLEELGKTGYVGFRIAIALHAYMATSYIDSFGSEELKQKYLVPAIKGERISALGISETEAGSDLSNLQTTAVIDGGDYIINGHKKYVINGNVADFIILVVKTQNTNTQSKRGTIGISLMIVDLSSPGISKTMAKNIGMYSSGVAEIQFDHVRVPRTNLIGCAEQGFIYLMKCLQLERLTVAVLTIGDIENCINLTWQYLSKRKVYNNTLNKLQVIRHQMADHITALEAARQFTYHTVWLYQQNELPIVECSMAKLKTTELAQRVVRDCLQFQGANGYYSDSFISRMYRDIPMATIGAGSSEVMRDIIAQLALDDKKEIA